MPDFSVRNRTCTVREFVQANSGRFAMRQVQWWINRAADNGMAEAGVVGRHPACPSRWVIDVDRFEKWFSTPRPFNVRRFSRTRIVRMHQARSGKRA